MLPDEEVASFIRSTFRSVWALELLCFLRQSGDRDLSHAEMVAGLRGSELVVTQSLESLTAAGLVLAERDGSARYRPATEALDAFAESTAALYSKSPNAVRRMIVAAANPGITAFADAFRLRKD
jgi:DNA-binding transcriptional ArsR family regulator